MDVKEKIILGSIKLMNENGVRKTTMDGVASALGISKRTIYENFTDKADLVASVVRYLISSSHEKFAKIKEESKSTIEGLFTMLDGIESEFSFNGRIPIDVRKHYPDLFQEDFVAHYEHMYQTIVGGLQRGVDQGEIMKTTDLKFAVFSLLETVTTLMQNSERMFTTTQVSPVDAFKYVTIHFFRGIATPKGIEQIDKILDQKYHNK